MTEAYPLQWPAGRPRTQNPERSRFDVTPDKARRELLFELERLGTRDAVLSTNIPLRQDGQPYAGRRPSDEDTGVAVYFEYKGQATCFACDRWDRVRDNIQAVRHTIAALRGITRWGTGDMMEAAFTGFTALPPPVIWRKVLGLDRNEDVSRERAEECYRRLARDSHPDRVGGSSDRMAVLNGAIAQAREELR